MDLDKAIESRKSVRKFKLKKPDWRDIIECIDAARYAPTAGKNSTVKFVLIDDKEKIKRIADAAQQNFIVEAHYVLVAVSDNSQLKTSFGEDGEKYAMQQLGAAIQNFLLKIEEKGLATCWIGHFSENQIKSNLRVSKGTIEAIFPIGYSNENNKPSKKIELANTLYFNNYGTKKMNPVRQINI